MTQAANLAALGSNTNTTGILPAAGGGTAGTAGVTGFKNRIINGNMSIWQRGTSFSAIGYTADRWSFYAGTSPVVTQSTDVPTGYRYSAALSGTGSTGFTQKIESYNVSDLSGQTITVSFWLKQTSGAGSNAISISLSYATAQDNFGSTTSIGSTNITTTSSWAQYSATFTNLPSGVTNGLQCTIVTNSGSAVAFQLTGVQLEVGTAATNFDVRSYGTELGLCYRYYYLMSGVVNQDILVGTACDQSTWLRYGFALPTTMRTAPSLVSAGGTSYANLIASGGRASTSISLDNTSATNACVNLYSAGISAGTTGTFRLQAGLYLGFSAEL
jgi:hypothetical protein